MEQLNNREKPPYAGFLAYKLKVKPEDFQVREESSLAFSPDPSGEFQYYRLTKSGWNTIDLLMKIARESGIPFHRFRYGGKKDRHALTEQFVTVAHPADISCSGDKWKLEWLGSSNAPMSSESILRNFFRITIRSMHASELPALEKNLSFVRKFGVPNYFDEQRFGILGKDGSMVAGLLFRGDIDAALKLYITYEYAGDKRHAKERKRAIAAEWGNWKRCLDLATTSTERRLFRTLSGKKRPGEELFDLLPREELSLQFSAFQSWIWNEMVRRELERSDDVKVTRVKLSMGDLAFPLEMEESALRRYQDLILDVPGPTTEYRTVGFQEIYEEILDEMGLTPASLKLRKVKSAFLGAFARNYFVRPEQVRILEKGTDDFYQGRRLCRMEFALPRGSYGTIVVKRSTLRPPRRDDFSAPLESDRDPE